MASAGGEYIGSESAVFFGGGVLTSPLRSDQIASPESLRVDLICCTLHLNEDVLMRLLKCLLSLSLLVSEYLSGAGN